MFLSPSIMALMLVSALVSLMMLLASAFAIQVIRFWDIKSGSEKQLNLERRTYLISTLLGWVFAAELISLLLFIYNAEAMSGQFVGAMCATGVLNANDWGWPTLFLKISIFFSGAAWLVLNNLDNKGFDYPLIKLKYGLLLLIAPLVVAELVVQTRYLSELNPDVITSCCGALFSADAEGVAAEVSGLKPKTAMLALYGTGLFTIFSGLWYIKKRSFGWLFALSGGLAFIVALVTIVSFIALYVYEHPHHHCPFCILKSGHDFVGYALYIPLFLATALALGTGALSPWKNKPSLRDAVEVSAPKMAWFSIALFALFYLLSIWSVLSSNLVMTGVWW